MAKLVVLAESLKGLSHELKVERTTVGRVEDNTFPITEPSVSSHHCEILLKGSDVVVKDLNSTNGTFINGERITEAVLKPGQTLRLGNVELKLDGPASATKKQLDATMVIPQGVKRDEIGAARESKLSEKAGFHKKSDKLNKIFLVGGAVVLLIIVGLIIFAFIQRGAPPE
ncbi:MAG: FHA domain-containing protein [Verrucomicrobiales bacterium]|nr:FHA domain-containing protein [Verrucomicrobiales bacterium]